MLETPLRLPPPTALGPGWDCWNPDHCHPQQSASAPTLVRGDSAPLFEEQSNCANFYHVWVQIAGEDTREMHFVSNLKRCGLLKCVNFPKHRKATQMHQVVKKTMTDTCSRYLISRLKIFLDFWTRTKEKKSSRCISPNCAQFIHMDWRSHHIKIFIFLWSQWFVLPTPQFTYMHYIYIIHMYTDFISISLCTCIYRHITIHTT